MKYYDLHSHLLPGVDDGCVDLSESLACLQALSNAGCQAVACTPHMGLPRYRQNTPRNLDLRVAALKQSVLDSGIEIEIYGGGEFRLVKDSIEWWKEFTVPVLGESRFVLFDTWERQWHAFLDRSLDWLLAQNYVPILAHPERMLLGDSEWEAKITELLGRGILLQGNFKSFADDSRPEVKARAGQLLDRGVYYILASDSHGPTSLDSRWQGFDELKQNLTQESLKTLLWDRPRKILMGGEPEHDG
ncbi:MAG: CpsB/CapC family capsule biosynthesis tyrosine phosphatase [Planctomycetota bacterium]|nr:hypothetical protein [Pirellulaceae bacterium]MEC8239750.1 CpsB/CapC family capsule biosynthesis tyrosine phosphatase [Planctomycetota bacterium]MEC8343817.1 CpsB/CapC family capsule biosynthesis tyrosine phosphatase [Planctomycetota bacterium]MED5286388.1 CpsB/CapC family capsule biosynthesis tyrosine phosphatase [Planctomycetota bacterium]